MQISNRSLIEVSINHYTRWFHQVLGCIGGLALMVASAPASPHDLISVQHLNGERALVELQAARDRVLAEPRTSDGTKQAARAFVATAFVWDHAVLMVCFWQTDRPALLRAIADQANRWSVGTNVRFDFGSGMFRQCADATSADIRVTTAPMPREYYAPADLPLIGWDWSEYGNLPSKTRPYVSMSLVNAPNYFAFGQTPEFNFLIAHEFGHALGLIHEHQRIDCTQYLADKAVVMATYRFQNDSDYQSFVANLAQIPSSDPALRPVALASFDVQSVMLYNFPQKIWKQNLPNNPCARPVNVEHPDPNDIAAVNYMYGAAAPALVAGGLSTPPGGAATGPAPAAVTPRAAADRPTTLPAPSAPPSPAYLYRSARATLEDAHAQHLRSASVRRSLSRSLEGPASGHAQAAASIKSLLNEMDLIAKQARY